MGAGIMGKEVMGIPPKQDEILKIKDYRVFGRTGFEVSDISCGSIREENILRAMLDSGANLIETSEIYSNGNHERQVGNILKDYDREKIFLVSKIHYRSGPLDSKSEIIDRFNKSLERLNTEYIDGYMIHGALSSDDVRNKHFHSAIKELKKDGKVRFAGVSCHGSSYFDNPEESMEQVLGTAIEDGGFDFVEMIYNFFEPEMGSRILEKCSRNNIGTMIMKSNPVYIFEVVRDIVEKAGEEGTEVSDRDQRYFDKYGKQAETAQKFFAEYGITSVAEIRKAALQFVLSNENVHTIPSLVANISDIDLHLNVSGTRLEGKSEARLNNFNEIAGFLNCRIGCDICEGKCPYNIPVNTILRYNYYYMAKKEEKHAMKLYSELHGRKPDACVDCEGFCEKACPYGVMTRGLLSIAHQNLSFIENLKA
jgi:predicted aldo/keto reductase-like oxidoreductase